MTRIGNFKCEENPGNILKIDADVGELMLTTYSREMGCELVVTLTGEQFERFVSAIEAASLSCGNTE